MTENWLADALGAGLDATALELHLQPVVSLASDRIVGAESFIRWRDAVHGLVPSSDWIPLAESTGAIVDRALTALPLSAGCSNPGTGRVVSFNLGGRQLLDAEFMDANLEIPAEVAAGLAVEIRYLQFSVDRANRVAPEWSWLGIPDFDVRLGKLHAHRRRGPHPRRRQADPHRRTRAPGTARARTTRRGRARPGLPVRTAADPERVCHLHSSPRTNRTGLAVALFFPAEDEAAA